MKEPNWILTALFGAVLGFIPEIVKIIKYMVLRFSKNRIIGDWYVYEITISESKILFTTGTCIIKNGVLHRFSIKMKNDNLNYRGIGDCEDNHFYIMIHNINDKSVRKETCWQRYDFSYNDYNCLFGLWLSNNYDGKTTCGYSILSRMALKESDIEKIVLSKYIVEKKPIITVNIDNNNV